MTTDPDPAERLVALRSNRPPQPFPHAQATKILTAGVSLSAVFGIVAYLGHSAAVHAAADERALERLAVSQAAAGALYKPPPTVPPSTTVPTTVAPVQPGVSTTAVPAPQIITVPVPVPAPAPQRPRSSGTPAPSNTTKSSG